MLSYDYLYVDADKCVYTRLENNVCVILSLYVDNILIFGTKLKITKRTKKLIASNFNMKYLDKANIISGIKIVRSNKGLMLSQEYYTKKILNKFGHIEGANS